MEGMAFEQPPGSQVDSFGHTEFFYGFMSVHRARWGKPAVVPKKRGNDSFIAFDKEENKFFHAFWMFLEMD